MSFTLQLPMTTLRTHGDATLAPSSAWCRSRITTNAGVAFRCAAAHPLAVAPPTAVM